MNKQEAIDVLRNIGNEIDDFCNGGKHWSDKDKKELKALNMAIEALQAEAVQGCEGCRHNELTPQRHCIRCRRYWKDSYERKGGDDE